jgi:hypothetical protein
MRSRATGIIRRIKMESEEKDRNQQWRANLHHYWLDGIRADNELGAMVLCISSTRSHDGRYPSSLLVGRSEGRLESRVDVPPDRPDYTNHPPPVQS